jgi:hypothetical protein
MMATHLRAKHVGNNTTDINSVVFDNFYFHFTYRISQRGVLVKQYYLTHISGKYLKDRNYDFRFYDEVDKHLSPVLLVFLNGNQAMVCFAAFQLAFVSLTIINLLIFINKNMANCIQITHNLTLCEKWQRNST